MGKGLRLPVGVDISGGANLEDDPEHLNTILRLVLSGGEDDNPFQNLGIKEAIIFSVNSPGAHGAARNAVQRVLGKFSDRLKLHPNSLIQLQQLEDGVIELSFQYINLDSNDIIDFSTTFR